MDRWRLGFMKSDIVLRPRTIPTLLIVGTLGLSVIMGTGYAPVGILGVVSAIVAALVVAATATDPGLGVALLPLVGATVPFAIGTGTQSPLVTGLLFGTLLLVLWVIRSMLAGDLTLPRSAVVAPAVAIIVIWVFALLYAEAFHSPLVYVWNDYLRPRLGQLGVTVVSIGVFLLALKSGHDRRWMRLTAWGLIGVSAVSIIAFYLNLGRFVSFLSIFGLFTMWVVALAYGQALFNDSLPRGLRVVLVVLAMAWLFKAMFLQTIWFSGWVPSLIAVVVITFLRSRRVFFTVVVISAIAIATHWPAVQNALWHDKVKEGDLSRLGIWEQQVQLFQENPLFGTGPAGYAAYNMSVYLGSPYSMSTHSNYMDILTETGIVGAAVFAWFLGSVLVVGWQARSRWRSGFEGAMAQAGFAGLLGLLVAMGLGDWLIPFVYNQTIAGFRFTVHSWVLLGFLASLALAANPAEAA